MKTLNPFIGIFLCIFCMVTLSMGQGQEPCSQEQYLKQQEEKNQEQYEKRMDLERGFLNRQASPESSSQSDIPMKAYIVRRSDGTGGLSECDLEDAIAIANIQYAVTTLNIVISELEYIDSDTYYDINSFAEGDDLYFSDNDPGSMNCYFVNYANGYCGWANFPSSSKRFILLANSCAMNTSTLAHEIGHYFGLYHTHQGGNELVDGSNCTTAGDLLCDTPADPNLSGQVNTSCQYTGTAVDANGDPYVPDPLNLMSYSRKTCRDDFSVDNPIEWIITIPL